MSALAISQPDASAHLPTDWWLLARVSIRNVVIGAALLTTMVLAILLGSSHDPNECRYGEPPHIEIYNAPIPSPPVIARIVSSTLADVSNHCPGAAQFTTGDFEFR
jgi:hypothetical protein